jgi:hypothetical protein
MEKNARSHALLDPHDWPTSKCGPISVEAIKSSGMAKAIRGTASQLLRLLLAHRRTMATAAACLRLSSPFSSVPVSVPCRVSASRRCPRRAGLLVSAAAAGSPPTVLVTGAGGRTGSHPVPLVLALFFLYTFSFRIQDCNLTTIGPWALRIACWTLVQMWRFPSVLLGSNAPMCLCT